ncbi:copper chaperone PCu(A)C [Qipengyuania sp. CAU 1752]
MRSLVALVIAAVPLALAACNDGVPDENALEQQARSDISIEAARLALPPVSGNPAALYFELGNDGAEPLALLGVTVTQADSAIMHDIVREDGAVRMVDMSPAMLASGQTVTFEPGGRHVMVMGLDPAVGAGDMVDVTLRFDNGREYSRRFEVVAAGEVQ